MPSLKLVTCLAALALAIKPAAASAELSAQEIVDKMTEGSLGGVRKGRAKLQMLIKRADGRVDKRVMETKVAKVEGLRRSRTEFSDPPDVKGTVVLQLEQKGGEDTQYLYLPSLRRSRQIAGANKNSAFVGSDFTYGDMEYRDAKSGKKQKLPDEKINNIDCYKIDVEPDAMKNSEYSKLTLWVDKEHFLTIKMNIFDKDGKLLKVFEGLKMEPRDDHWMLTLMRLRNVQKKTETALNIAEVNTKAEFSANEFHPDSLDK